MSLRYKLLFVLTTLPVISLSLYLFMATDLFKKDKIAYVFDSSATVSRSLATQARIELQGALTSLGMIVQNFDLNQNQFNPVAQDLFNKNGKIQALVLYRHEVSGVYSLLGQVIKENPHAKSFSQDAKVQEKIRELAFHNSAAVSESALAMGYINFAFRLGEKGGQNQFVAVALYKAEDLVTAFEQSGVYSSIAITPSGVLSLGTAEGMSSDIEKLKTVLGRKAAEGTAELTFRDGLVYLVSYATVGVGDLAVISKVDKQKALKAVEVLLYKSVLFFIALIAGTLLMSVVLSGQLTSTLRELFDATTKIAQGDFSVRVVPRSNDEVGGLAESFNYMAGEVSRLMAETAEKARMQNELATVRTVQETLFPASFSQFGPLKIKGHFEPASECGGDWWSYSRVDEKIYIWIGDATGHGAPAALITAAARSAAAVIESLPNVTPGSALSIMNRAIHQTSKGQIMMTFFMAAVDVKNGTFTYASASHDPPYLMKRSGNKLSKKDLQPLNDVNGPRLGDNPNFQYEDISVPFGPGDQAFFYTDGILDVQDIAGNKWGERQFLKTLVDCANKADVEAKIDGLCEVVNNFRQGSVLIDDVTMVFCEYDAAEETQVQHEEAA